MISKVNKFFPKKGLISGVYFWIRRKLEKKELFIFWFSLGFYFFLFFFNFGNKSLFVFFALFTLALIGKFKSIEDFVQNVDHEIYWWGAGSVSVIYLNQLKRSGVNITTIRVVDSDKTKQGCLIPGVDITVGQVSSLRGKNIGKLIIASSLFNEIEKTMSEKDITAKDILVLDS